MRTTPRFVAPSTTPSPGDRSAFIPFHHMLKPGIFAGQSFPYLYSLIILLIFFVVYFTEAWLSFLKLGWKNVNNLFSNKSIGLKKKKKKSAEECEGRENWDAQFGRCRIEQLEWNGWMEEEEEEKEDRKLGSLKSNHSKQAINHQNIPVPLGRLIPLAGWHLQISLFIPLSAQ